MLFMFERFMLEVLLMGFGFEEKLGLRLFAVDETFEWKADELCDTDASSANVAKVKLASYVLLVPLNLNIIGLEKKSLNFFE